mmetsp:Transcript_21346/g.53816  ORF Transcript_21346/g.53816 Transcript_21346/m.53816 type:complete len:291 (+) Transcript_21346:351-1223(+)
MRPPRIKWCTLQRAARCKKTWGITCLWMRCKHPRSTSCRGPTTRHPTPMCLPTPLVSFCSRRFVSRKTRSGLSGQRHAPSMWIRADGRSVEVTTRLQLHWRGAAALPPWRHSTVVRATLWSWPSQTTRHPWRRAATSRLRPGSCRTTSAPPSRATTYTALPLQSACQRLSCCTAAPTSRRPTSAWCTPPPRGLCRTSWAVRACAWTNHSSLATTPTSLMRQCGKASCLCLAARAARAGLAVPPLAAASCDQSARRGRAARGTLGQGPPRQQHRQGMLSASGALSSTPCTR